MVEMQKACLAQALPLQVKHPSSPVSRGLGLGCISLVVVKASSLAHTKKITHPKAKLFNL
jgi:hypothetical protein